MESKARDLKIIRISVISVLCVLLCIAIYFIIAPSFVINPKYIIEPRELKKLDDARNYFSILQSIFTIIISFAGIALGFFYYIHKIRIEQENENNKFKKANLEKLYNEINNFDEYVIGALTDIITSKNNTSQIQMLERKWSKIECMLDSESEYFGFKTNERLKIYELHSFVDNIIQSKEKISTQDDLDAVIEQYGNCIKEVRRMFFTPIK